MCGFAGLLDLRQRSAQTAGQLRGLVEGMAGTLTHRGPDDGGCWVDPSSQVALGFRRLAIIDLTAAGTQPMTSSNGQLTIAFNGEIYNSEELRARLIASEGPLEFRGHSDTEVLLTAIQSWGLERTLKQAVGMFALAVWDRRHRQLSLARDRFGEKPLYYATQDGWLLFGSELKALTRHPGFRRDLDQGALAEFLRYGFISSPGCIYQSARKLPPGTSVTIRVPAAAEDSLPQPSVYWSAAEHIGAGQHRRNTPQLGDAHDQLRGLLQQAVRRQMVSDVPIGALLSGGIDSSLIVALMQEASTRPVRTFSIGFEEAAYDEAPHAREVARHLGTDHTELYVRPDEAEGVIPDLPAIYDEPFADVSQIPTVLVARLARRHVTVCLSGDGGDELFGGYTRYAVAERWWKRIGWIPRSIRQAAAKSILALPPFQDPPSRSRRKVAAWGARLLAARDFQGVYDRLMSSWSQPQETLAFTVECERPMLPANGLTRLQQMRWNDLKYYLPDDILVKVDRASMSTSLESRAPYLDHDLAEFALGLPDVWLQRDGQAKWLLRQVLDEYVPRPLIDRPKMGFGVPMEQWLRGRLRPWAEDLLSVVALAVPSVWNIGDVRRLWSEHLSGTRNHSSRLWRILMFQAWFRAQQSTSVRAAA